MRSSWFPGFGAALFAGALVYLAGCNAAESLASSSRETASNAASEVMLQRTLLFQESALEIGERAKNWRASSGVDVGRFSDKARRGVSFQAQSGSRVRARTGALPGTFGRATKAKVRLRAPDASPSHPVTVRFEFFNAGGAVEWSRPVTFVDSRWKNVSLRLPGQESLALALLSPMRNVSSWGMTFESAAEVRLEKFELWRRGAPKAPALGLAIVDLAIGEPPSMQASRTLSSAWFRDEPVVRLDTAFDGLISLHRQMASTFPGLPDLEERAPLTSSTYAGVQTLWQLAESAIGEPQRARKPRSRVPAPKLPASWAVSTP
ncbi:MAG: hypothetical protein KUG77_03580 [Nannocystaceae bacterium]|nr:hypothetical protein [Nannocystaceae bacterium]